MASRSGRERIGRGGNRANDQRLQPETFVLAGHEEPGLTSFMTRAGLHVAGQVVGVGAKPGDQRGPVGRGRKEPLGAHQPVAPAACGRRPGRALIADRRFLGCLRSMAQSTSRINDERLRRGPMNRRSPQPRQGLERLDRALVGKGLELRGERPHGVELARQRDRRCRRTGWERSSASGRGRSSWSPTGSRRHRGGSDSWALLGRAATRLEAKTSWWSRWMSPANGKSSVSGRRSAMRPPSAALSSPCGTVSSRAAGNVRKWVSSTPSMACAARACSTIPSVVRDGIERRCSAGDDGDMHLRAGLGEPGHRPAAPQHLVVGVRRDHQKPAHGCGKRS